MKKLILVTLVLSCCLAFLGCNKYYNVYKNSLAEIRYNIFTGSSENFDITFMSGKREKNYVINGYNTELIDFGVITIKLKDESLDCTNSSFALTVNTLRYEDNLEKNPFDGTLVADIGVVIDNEISAITIKVIIDKISEDITLTNLSSQWELNCYDALKIASKQLKQELSPFITNEFLGECYVKIIPDSINNNGEYLWYINFAGREGTQHSVIINPITKEILAKK